MHQTDDFKDQFLTKDSLVEHHEGEDFYKVSHLVPMAADPLASTNAKWCYEAPHNELVAMLYRVQGQLSFMAWWYSDAKVELGSCVDAGYNVSYPDMYKLDDGNTCFAGTKFFIKPDQDNIEGMTLRRMAIADAMKKYTAERTPDKIGPDGREGAKEVAALFCIYKGAK